MSKKSITIYFPQTKFSPKMLYKRSKLNLQEKAAKKWKKRKSKTRFFYASEKKASCKTFPIVNMCIKINELKKPLKVGQIFIVCFIFL